MGVNRGYARVSKPKQKIQRQIENILREYPDAVLYKDKASGRYVEGRNDFKRLMREVKLGDTIVFDSVSRMSRNADEGVELYFELYDKGINLVFLKESYINTEVYRDAISKQIEIAKKKDDKKQKSSSEKLLINLEEALNEYVVDLAKEQIRMAFEMAEKEVEDLRQRTREGLAVARAKGKILGQQKGKTLNVKKKAPAKAVIKQHSKDFGGSLTDKECMRLAGVSRNTYYKYKRELIDEINGGNRNAK